jgi:hypothetical protein
VNKKADQPSIKTLIEKSSLGTKSAQAARRTVSIDHGRSIVRVAAARGAAPKTQKKK